MLFLLQLILSGIAWLLVGYVLLTNFSLVVGLVLIGIILAAAAGPAPGPNSACGTWRRPTDAGTF